MSSPPPNPSLPLPGSSVTPAPAVLTPEEVFGALRDLTQAVQEIRLFLAGPYGPHTAAPPIAATAPPWQPLDQAASAALAGPLQLPSTATTASPWLQWQPPLLGASAAPGTPPQQPLPGATPQQPLQLQRSPPVSSGPASPAPEVVPIHQVRFPPHRFRLGSLPATCRR